MKEMEVAAEESAMEAAAVMAVAEAAAAAMEAQQTIEPNRARDLLFCLFWLLKEKEAEGPKAWITEMYTKLLKQIELELGKEIRRYCVDVACRKIEDLGKTDDEKISSAFQQAVGKYQK